MPVQGRKKHTRKKVLRGTNLKGRWRMKKASNETIKNNEEKRKNKR